MLDVFVGVAASSRAGRRDRPNADAVGINGCVLWGDRPYVFPLGSPPYLSFYPSQGQPASILVADGLGRGRGAQQASLIAAQALSDPTITGPRGLVAAIASTHRTLQTLQRDDPELSDLGTTVAGVTVTPRGRVVCFNVGDSRVYSTQAGLLIQATRDDTYDEPSSSRRQLRRWLGGPEPVDPPWQRELGVAAHRRLIVCTDGFYDCFDDMGIVQAILIDPEPANPMDLLTRLLAAAGAPADDASLAVVDVWVTGVPGAPA